MAELFVVQSFNQAKGWYSPDAHISALESCNLNRFLTSKLPTLSLKILV